jgi:hypothetical protein
MLVGAMLLLALTAGAADKVVVVEVSLQAEGGHEEVGQKLASALGGMSPSDAAARIGQILPPVSPSGRAEPLMEADRLLRQGRDAYVQGRFEQAAEQLGQARELLRRAIDSFEEERKAAETLFRAHMYLAFTLRAQGGDFAPQAVEAMKEALRTFPNLEPAFSEYGPENIRFYREVKKQMEQAPTARLRVRTPGEQASVYMNGRLVGVTPLDLRRVYPGYYRLHLREGTASSRAHVVEVKAGDTDLDIDFSLDQALRSDAGTPLVYANAAERRARHARHAARLGRLLDAQTVVVYWVGGGLVHLGVVDAMGNERHASCAPADAISSAIALREGRIGEFVKSEDAPGPRIWTWVAGGVAVAALAAAIGFGLSAEADRDTLDRRYPDGAITDPTDLSLRDDARGKALTADVLFGVAGAAAVTSIVLFYYEGRPHSERAQLVPAMGPRFAGAQWTLRF